MMQNVSECLSFAAIFGWSTPRKTFVWTIRQKSDYLCNNDADHIILSPSNEEWFIKGNLLMSEYKSEFELGSM